MQGFNMGRYMPPASLDPSLNPLLDANHANAFNKGSRPRVPNGSLVVRFEMPFKIWCSGCYPEAIIDQGSRFNAAKKLTGKFLTSPVFEFKMKHAECGKTITIETDPSNRTYKITGGGRRADWEWKSLEEAGDVGQAWDLENPKNGFAIVEAERYKARKNEDAAVSDTRISNLIKANQKNELDWKRNAEARKIHRTGRHQRHRAQEEADALAGKYGLPFDIMPVTEQDNLQAGSVVFGQKDAEEVSTLDERRMNAQPIVGQTHFTTLVRPANMNNSQWKKSQALHNFNQAAKLQLAEIKSNDFRIHKRPKGHSTMVLGERLGIKYRRTVEEKDDGETINKDADTSDNVVETKAPEIDDKVVKKQPVLKKSLVDYSDSESES